MGEVNHIVDHLKLEYKGVFSVRNLFRMFTRWMKEGPYEKGGDFISEMDSSHGKCMEYHYIPWKKETDSLRHFIKIRLLFYDIKKVDMVIDGKKERLDHGKVILYMDGFCEYDYEARWNGTPMFVFLRTMFTKFFYRRYTNFMERIIVKDCHDLYQLFENFFNMYKSYKPVLKTPHFY